MKRILSITSALLFISAFGAFAGTIYNNAITDQSSDVTFSTGPHQQIGDSITLGGADRTLTSADVQFYNELGASGTFSAILRFFNTGDQVTPVGSQIGGNYKLDNLPIAALSSATISFSNLNLLAPDNLVFTLEVLNTSTGIDLGVELFDPPTTGSSDNSSFIVKDTTFTTSSAPVGYGNLYLSLDATTTGTATPEPSTGLMLGVLAILAMAALRPKLL
jgi:hypothetical protein